MKEKIVKALKKLESTEPVQEGSFCLQHTASVEDLPLRISVSGYGELNLPLDPKEAESLLKIANPSKFGWRTQTVLDKNVRHSSEIAAEHIQVKYGTDDQKFLEIVDKIREGLGLPVNTKLTAHLHNLLIYSPGQFFGPHQDTEKLGGMIATLVVVLPSPHLGGSLIIDHRGKKKTIRCENTSSRQINFIAFYADCHHQVKTVKEGYRLALTYNLVLESSNNQKKRPPIDNSALKKALAEHFASHKNKTNNYDHPIRLLYLMDHDYTQHGLSWQLLKGIDRVRAAAFQKTAEELGLRLYLVLASVKETWTAEENYYDYDSCYESHCEDYDTEDFEPEPEEFIDSEVTLSNWLDTEDKPASFKELYIQGSEICWTTASEELKPFESQYEGYMGNYGNTIDYWYRRAGIIMWRTSDELSMRFDLTPEAVFGEFFKRTEKQGNEAVLRADLQLLVPYLCAHQDIMRNFPIIELLKLAGYIQEAELAYSILCHNDMLSVSLKTTSEFIRLQNIYGKEWCLKLLQKWQENKGRQKPYKDFTNIIKILLLEGLETSIAKFLLSYQQKTLASIDKLDRADSDASLELKAKARVERMIQFLEAAHVLASIDIYNSTINYIIVRSNLYLHLELVELIIEMEKIPDKEKWGYELLKKHVSTALLIELKQGLRSPNDWSIALRPNCSCVDCNMLKAFLKSSNEKTKIWPIVQAKRDHISFVIKNSELPVKVDTEKKGSPYKLILTKRNSLYENAKKRFEKVSAVCETLNITVVDM